VSRESFDDDTTFEKAAMLELTNLLKLRRYDSESLIKIFGIKFNKEEGSLKMIMEVGRSNLAQLTQFKSKIDKSWTGDELKQILQAVLK